MGLSEVSFSDVAPLASAELEDDVPVAAPSADCDVLASDALWAVESEVGLELEIASEDSVKGELAVSGDPDASAGLDTGFCCDAGAPRDWKLSSLRPC